MRYGSTGLALLLVSMPSEVFAQDDNISSPPAIYTKVVECRAITDAAQRLACFDSAVGALVDAQQSKSLVIVSREDVREARRGLFGFSLPKINIFGRGDDQDDEVDEVTATVKSASQGRSGWIFHLGDNGVWEQTDGAFISAPKAGDTLSIRQASFGSYFGRLNDRVGFRIKRIR